MKVMACSILRMRGMWWSYHSSWLQCPLKGLRNWVYALGYRKSNETKWTYQSGNAVKNCLFAPLFHLQDSNISLGSHISVKWLHSRSVTSMCAQTMPSGKHSCPWPEFKEMCFCSSEDNLEQTLFPRFVYICGNSYLYLKSHFSHLFGRTTLLHCPAKNCFWSLPFPLPYLSSICS